MDQSPTAPPADYDGFSDEEQLAASLGVVRHVSHTYVVGEHSYTSLTDAVAQARRLAKRGGAGT